MKEITDEVSIRKFMEATKLWDKHPIPSKIYYSYIGNSYYVVGMVIGFKTVKVTWRDTVEKEREDFKWNPKHPSHTMKTLLEAGY